MRNRCSLFILACCLSLVALAGCSSEGETDSETHWQSALGACTVTSDCETGLTCLCGVCTEKCTAEDDTCAEMDSAASCALAGADLPEQCVSEAPSGGGLCLEACQATADCQQRDSDLQCVENYCVSSDDQPEPDGGTDGGDIADIGDTGPYERECQQDDFVYHDRGCDLPAPDADLSEEEACQEEGDGKCYARCETDADCTEPERPHCSNLGLYSDEDYNCANDINICHSEDFNDCRF